ncbi:hypothetical protein B5X24_HaOG202412 [Helicoverpa armigera]|nr:hypothetical protein B5X24_HaOG202412 [Helicoverpa armigera]
MLFESLSTKDVLALSKLESDKVPELIIRLTCVRRHKVRFEELSTVRPSVNSDPIPHWAEHSIDDRVVKAARSCEIFVLHTPKRNFR